MTKFHSYSKLFLVILFIGFAFYLEIIHKQQASVIGIISGIALIEALNIFNYETGGKS